MKNSRFRLPVPSAGDWTVLVLGFVFALALPSAVRAQNPQDELNDQLRQLLVQMDRVATSLNEARVDREQLIRQEAITNQLALLVQQFSSGEQSTDQPSRQQASPDTSQSGSREGSGQATGESMSESGVATVEGREPDSRQLILKAWGDLPEQLRFRSGTGISPEFLPGYEKLIRDYYRRMSR